MFELIRRESLATTRWRNGAGRKADIANGAGWHVGFAFLDQDAPFSDYAGHDRTITLVDGPGFALDFVGRELLVTRRHEPAPFDGGAAAQCRVRGPCVVLNAMTERATYVHSVRIGRAADCRVMAREEGGMIFVVVLEGSITLDGAGDAGRFDTLRLQDSIGIGGDAVLAVIRITPVS